MIGQAQGAHYLGTLVSLFWLLHPQSFLGLIAYYFMCLFVCRAMITSAESMGPARVLAAVHLIQQEYINVGPLS